jgi:hypothetical protein
VDLPPPESVPAIDLVLGSLVTPARVPGAAKSGPSNRAARLGLVLAIVVALAGVVSAVAKSGDDARPTTTASSGAAPEADEADHPTDQPDPAEAVADPLAASTPAVAPAGFEIRRGNHLSMAVPVDWRSLDGDDLQQILDGGVDELYPDLDPSIRDAMQSMVGRGALFMAVDTTGPDAGRSINAIRVLGEAPLDDIEDQIKAQYRSMGVGIEVVGSERRDTPLGEALRIEAHQEIAGHDVTMVQYYVPFDGHSYIVTGTETDGIVDQAVQTLRVGDAV